MKKSIILCLSILMIALTGCKKDQNSWGKLAEGAITLKIGESKQLTFTSDGNKKPQWTTDDANIATVDANGVVTGVRVGTVYVYVNGLSCKVTVTDDFMAVVEPIQDWYADDEDVMTYMVKNFGNITIPEETYDTAIVIKEITRDTTFRQDTIYVPGTDPAEIDTIVTVIDTIIADTTFDTIPYIAVVTYTYESSLSQFADVYTYQFEFDPETRESYLRMATMTVSGTHVKEIETFLNNRYVETSKGNYKAVNEWMYYSYILNDSPNIIYSASKIADK